VTARFFGQYDVAAFETPGPWNEALARFIGMPVRLVRAADRRSGVDALPVSLLSSASVAKLRDTSGEAAIDERRFRPNLYIGGAAEPHEEDAWIERHVHIGGALLHVRMRDPRCMMTTLSPDTGVRDMNTLRLITEERPDQPNESNFGVYATVVRPGAVAAGDSVEPAETPVTG
jgi:uncharacterized protein YcbX